MVGRVARSGLGRHRRCPGICAAFFDLSWAYWLKDLIPGASEVIEIDGGRLFFPDERPGDLIDALREHWEPGATAGAAISNCSITATKRRARRW
jgi:hypothetical protein